MLIPQELQLSQILSIFSMIIFHTRMNYYENKPDRESEAHEHRV